MKKSDVTVNIFTLLEKISIERKCCFELLNPGEKMYYSFYKNIRQHTNVFDIDNSKKCFLKTKSVY